MRGKAKQLVCLSVLGVSCVQMARLILSPWFQSVTVSRDCGFWVLLLFSSPLFAVSPPSPESSSTPAPCRSYRAGFLSNWSQYKCFLSSLFLLLNLPLLSSDLLIPNSNEPHQKLLFVGTRLGSLFMHYAKVNVGHHQCVCCCAAVCPRCVQRSKSKEKTALKDLLCWREGICFCCLVLLLTTSFGLLEEITESPFSGKNFIKIYFIFCS